MPRLATSFPFAALELVVAAACLPMLGCGNPAAAPAPTPPPAAWHSFAPNGADFTVSFPARPRDDTQIPGQVIASAAFGGIQYGMVCSREPTLGLARRADSQKLLEVACEAQARNIHAKVVSRERIDWAGHTGLAATLRPTNRDTEVRVRWYLLDKQILCLNVSGPRGSLSEVNAGRFFDSLRKTAPPTKPPTAGSPEPESP